MRKWLIVVIVIAVLYGISAGVSSVITSQQQHIAVIPVTGMIVSEHGSGFMGQGTQVVSSDIIDFLDEAEETKSIKAVIVEINSPGGTVVATREIAARVRSMDKPVVAVIREVGASGGYWIASAADVIIADPLSITGSIGVIASYLEFSGLMDDLGIAYEGLKAGELKDIGSPFREMTDNERAIIQKKLDMIHEYFINEVAENRGLSADQVKAAASGVYFLGTEALDLGLIDQLGNKKDAIEAAKAMAGIEDAELVEYEKEVGLFDLIAGIRTESLFNIGRGIAAELKTTEKLRFIA